MITEPTLPVLRGNFVLLKADSLQLLLPQPDVGATEYLSAAPRESDRTGLFDLDAAPGAAPRRVAALSSKMSPLPQFPAGRFLLTPFAALDDVLLCWSEVKVLIDAELQPQSLPPVMVPPGALLTKFVEIDDELVFCCTGEQLVAHAFAARN